MGENCKKIGDKLEKFGDLLFKEFGWELLAQNLEIECNNKNHKNSKNTNKQTHGIDLLFKYLNPFNNQYEAVIIECKNRKWNEFIPSNLNKWSNELLNTIECSVCTNSINNYLSECTLKTGILLFNSSDNEYTKERAEQNIAQMTVPRRKISTMLLLADTFLIEKWYSLANTLKKIKNEKIEDFGIVYPSIDSKWAKIDCIIPELLFSDYIISQYSQDIKTNNITITSEIKSIFSFDKVSQDAVEYLKSMIETMQLASHNKDLRINIYWYPENSHDIEFIKNLNNNSDDDFKYIPMPNPRIAVVDNGF